MNYIENYAVDNNAVMNPQQATLECYLMLFTFTEGGSSIKAVQLTNEGLMKCGPHSTFHLFITIL